jgi:predicted RND superfamily exporter protein
MSVGLSVDFVCHYGVGYMHAEIDKEHLNRRRKTPEPNNEQHNQTDKSTKVNNKFLNLWTKYNEANKERFLRIRDTFKRIGSAVLMAAFTTFLAGASMQPSHLTSFSKMGEFLMLVMFTSYVYSTFFFMPLCALFGPTNNFGDIRLKLCMQKLSQHLCACLAIDDSIDAKLKGKKDKVKKLKTAANGCKNQKSSTAKQPLVNQNTDITISFKNNDDKLAVSNNSTQEQ